MKTHTLIYFLLLSTTICLSQVKEGVVIYKKEKLNYVSDNEDFREKNKERVAYMNKVLDIDNNSKKILKELDFKLIFKNNKSSFKAIPHLEVEGNRYMKIAIGGSGRGIYYVDIEEDKYYRSVHTYGEDFIIKFPKRQWTLTDDSKKIGGYVCNRAFSIKEIIGRKGIIKKEIEAWYAPEINIQFGPLGYNGLPGLILELSVGNERFTVSKIELNTEVHITIKEPIKGRVVSKKEFDEIGVKMMKSFKEGF